MFDSSHTLCISGKEVKGDPARTSLWKLHPIYKFGVCGQGNCSSDTGWVSLRNGSRKFKLFLTRDPEERKGSMSKKSAITISGAVSLGNYEAGVLL